MLKTLACIMLITCDLQLVPTPEAANPFDLSSKVMESYTAIDWKGKRQDCLPPKLVAALEDVAKKFGPVYVNSTHRSKAHNKAVGGASKSQHLNCKAIDFGLVDKSKNKAALASIISDKRVGGYKLYAGGHFHIDTGVRRTW
jgi:uncharacterized protein YcbK (DUF882 family)